MIPLHINGLEASVEGKKSPARICPSLLVYIINEACTGCGAWKKVCPVEAIADNLKEIHSIDQDKYISCGLCYNTCKFDAIDKS